MGRVVLISDVQAPLGEQLVRRYLAEGYSVAATRSSQGARESALVSENEGFLLTDWNRKSLISTKNVLLAVLNRFDRIDETLVLESPAPERSLLQELSYDAIERAVDSWIKGTLFLIKGVLELYGKGGGLLGLINHVQQEYGTAFPPLEAALRGSFKAAAQALFASNTQKDVYINGFEFYCSQEAQAKEFAEFIFTTMKERGGRTSGRWFRYQPKAGFLSPLLGWKSPGSRK